MKSVLCHRYKAVIFDFGGVLMSTTVPIPFWKECEEEYGLPSGSIYRALVQMLVEVPNLDRELFEGRICADDIEADIIPEFFSKKFNIQFPSPLPILHEWMGPGKKIQYNERLLRVVRKLRKMGLRTAIMTNNYKFDRDGMKIRTPIDSSLFDVIVESVHEECMKPDFIFYEKTQSRLGHDIEPHQCIFLDDLKVNCHAGDRFGWTTIHVNPCDIDDAIDQLGHLLHIDFSLL